MTMNMPTHQYVAEKYIGSGNATIIYLVRRRTCDVKHKKYALKRYFLKSEKYIRGVLNERRLLEKISRKSPLLPSLEAAFWMGTSAALVMTAGSGIDLYDLINTRERQSEEIAKFYTAEILCGLERLHDLKIVHFDIKPENILITSSGHIMITDFDLSLDISSGPTRHPLKTTGTKHQASPEAVNFGFIDEKADIWNWACVLIELVDPSVHHPDLSIYEILRFDKEGRVNMKSFYSLSIELQSLLVSCFRINPQDRPSIREIKSCRFFEGINWDDAENCRLAPPIILNEQEIELIKEVADIETENPMILKNLYEMEMLDVERETLHSDGSCSYEKFEQNKEDLLEVGFNVDKIEELFADFAYPQEKLESGRSN